MGVHNLWTVPKEEKCSLQAEKENTVVSFKATLGRNVVKNPKKFCKLIMQQGIRMKFYLGGIELVHIF